MNDNIIIWILFNLFVLIMLALDLGVFHRKVHEVKVKEALIWSGIWIALALLFNIWIYFWKGTESALEFLTGYLIEKSLSVDNIFVFILIFSYFRTPAIYQHKVLFWGIIGALVMRAIFIILGITLIEKFHYIIYVFGIILILSGIKMLFQKDKKIHPEKNPILKLFKKIIPVSNEYYGSKFFTKINSRVVATPLVVTLIIIEITDLIFAVDSIPAILAITTDSFIVYTSNVFAILGLRALYFALAGIMKYFHHLHYGLSAILILVGLKMVLSDVYKIPILTSLIIISLILIISIIASLIYPKTKSDI